MASHPIAHTWDLPFSITSAPAVPSNVPNKHIHAVRDNSTGYVFKVIAYIKTNKEINLLLYFIFFLNYKFINLKKKKGKGNVTL